VAGCQSSQREETQHIDQSTSCKRPVGLLENRFELNHYDFREREGRNGRDAITRRLSAPSLQFPRLSAHLGVNAIQTLDLWEGQREETQHIDQSTSCKRPVGLLENRFEGRNGRDAITRRLSAPSLQFPRLSAHLGVNAYLNPVIASLPFLPSLSPSPLQPFTIGCFLYFHRGYRDFQPWSIQ
jgi:hypothetical protein